jgi:hypothetical protein
MDLGSVVVRRCKDDHRLISDRNDFVFEMST